MKFSIIIPVYMVERYLTQCVESVLCQTYTDYEILLVDDGSADGSSGICDRYAERDGRVTVIHKKNGGLSDARNFGVLSASGEYGIFVDSDDFWNDAGALQTIHNRLEDNPAQLINFSYFKYFEDTEKTVKMVQADDMPLSCSSYEEQMEYIMGSGLYIASAWNKAVSMDILRKTGFEVGKVSEDIIWSASLLSNVRSMDYVNLCFYCYRQRSGSISQTIKRKTCVDLAYAIKECCRIAGSENENGLRKKYLEEFAAYQFSTFIAVQSFTPEFEKEIIRELIPYSGILSHYRKRKVKYMYYGVKIFGLGAWCRIIRSTKSLWDSRREKI